MVTVRIVDLGELDTSLAVALAQQLGVAHVTEWGHLYDPAIWNERIAIDEFVAMLDPHSVNRTLAAFNGEPSITAFMGSVSLLDTDDLSGWEEARPWLASLFVTPAGRGQGVGTSLTNAAIDVAAGRGDPYTFLFTPDHVGYYERQGWRVVGEATAHSETVAVMSRGTARHAARRSVVSTWVGNPDIGGAYTYLRPGGRSSDRDALGVEVLPRVWLAGEYTSSAWPGTLHGAWESGERAAAAVLERCEIGRIAVVGSGMAGLGAALRLHGAGREVTVFESSTRPFGRAATDRTLGGPVHLGGAWMHGTVGHPLRALITAEPWDWDSVPTFVIGRGRLSEEDETRLADLYAHMEARLDEVSGDDLALGPSFRALLAELAENEFDASVLMCWARDEFENLYAAPIDDLALASRAEAYELPGGDHLITSPLDVTLTELSTALTIRVDTRVRAIHSTTEASLLEFSDGVLERFDAVICATPLPPIKTGRIAFHPSLPDAIVASMDRIGCGPVAKVVATFDEAFWGPNRAFYLTSSEDQPLEFFVDVSTVVGRPTLCGFAVGEHAAVVEAMGEDERCRLVDRLLREAGVVSDPHFGSVG